ncbi:hypothetical protein DAI22_07g276325 [Oryza sativa Japonica Group]|nr:hypothetical protein DAI22_07g276325 [Oryza sativa Japonica Group]
MSDTAVIWGADREGPTRGEGSVSRGCSSHRPVPLCPFCPLRCRCCCKKTAGPLQRDEMRAFHDKMAHFPMRNHIYRHEMGVSLKNELLQWIRDGDQKREFIQISDKRKKEGKHNPSQLFTRV